MDDPKLLVAVFAVVLSSISLAWQAATFVLTGGRVKVELKVGAISPSGVQQVLGPTSSMSGTWAQSLVVQGFTRPVVAVEVVNVGRQSVTVTGWGFQTPNSMGLSMYAYGEIVGPPMPHTLGAGSAPARWIIEADQFNHFVEAQEVVPTRRGWRAVRRWMKRRGQYGAVATVDLAGGRRKFGKEVLPIPHRIVKDA